MKGSKPDFLDLDKDNNKTESMKSAAASAKKMMKGGRVKKMGGGSMMKKREAMMNDQNQDDKLKQNEELAKMRADTSIQKTILSKTIPPAKGMPDAISIVRKGE